MRETVSTRALNKLLFFFLKKKIILICFLKNIYFYLFLAALGLICSTRDFRSLLWPAESFRCGMRTLSCSMWDLVT